MRCQPGKVAIRLPDACDRTFEPTRVPTVAKSLAALMTSGLLISDPPMNEVRQGQRVQYHVDDAAVSDIYLQLGQAIGEI